MKGDGFDNGSSLFKNSERKYKFQAEERDGSWCVVISNVIVRSGFAEESHAKMMASHLNTEVKRKVTECCVGGCYYCDF